MLQAAGAAAVETIYMYLASPDVKPCLLMDGLLLVCAGMTFSAMAVVSLMVVMPASMAADKLGRKWTIIPSCLGMAAALSLMAVSGDNT